MKRRGVYAVGRAILSPRGCTRKILALSPIIGTYSPLGFKRKKKCALGSGHNGAIGCHRLLFSMCKFSKNFRLPVRCAVLFDFCVENGMVLECRRWPPIPPIQQLRWSREITCFRSGVSVRVHLLHLHPLPHSVIGPPARYVMQGCHPCPRDSLLPPLNTLLAERERGANKMLAGVDTNKMRKHCAFFLGFFKIPGLVPPDRKIAEKLRTPPPPTNTHPAPTDTHPTPRENPRSPPGAYA